MKRLHRDDIYGWSAFDERLNIDFHSVVWVRPGGNVVIDPLPLSEHDRAHLEQLGSVHTIVITNSDHTRASESLAEATGARILGPAEPRVRVRPKALQFSVAEGTVSPESRTLAVKSEAAGLTFTATAETALGGDWLSITPDSGAVPGEITVAVISEVALALERGVYTGNI